MSTQPTDAGRELRQLVFDTVVMAEATEDANGRSGLVDARTKTIAAHVARAVEEATRALRAEVEALRQDAETRRIEHNAITLDLTSEISALREDVSRLSGEVIGEYSATHGKREWWSGGVWIYPGDRIVIVNSAAIRAARGTT